MVNRTIVDRGEPQFPPRFLAAREPQRGGMNIAMLTKNQGRRSKSEPIQEGQRERCFEWTGLVASGRRQVVPAGTTTKRSVLCATTALRVYTTHLQRFIEQVVICV